MLSSRLNAYALHFWNKVGIHVDVAERTVCLSKDSKQTSETDVCHLLADQLLPRLLAYDDRLVIHAGAVTDMRGAITFIGQSGFGKSTLTAYLTQQGFWLLSDDSLVFGSVAGLSAQSTYPSLRLMPDSLQSLYPNKVATTPVAEYSPKKRLPVGAYATYDAHPLKLMIFLEPATSGDKIELRPISPAQACMALIANSFALDPTDRTRAAKRLAQASSFASAVPGFALSYPRRYECLPAVLETILKTLDTVTTTQPDEIV